MILFVRPSGRPANHSLADHVNDPVLHDRYQKHVFPLKLKWNSIHSEHAHANTPSYSTWPIQTGYSANAGKGRIPDFLVWACSLAAYLKMSRAEELSSS